VKKAILDVLKSNGYIADVKVTKDDKFSNITVDLADLPYGLSLKRISKPGQRIYIKSQETPRVLSGLGVAIMSTSKGIMTGKEARKQKLGGELICEIH